MKKQILGEEEAKDGPGEEAGVEEGKAAEPRTVVEEDIAVDEVTSAGPT